MVCWTQSRQPRYLVYGMYACATALMVKGSGVIAIAAVGCLCLLALYKKEVKLRTFLKLPLIAYSVFALVVFFGRTIYLRLNTGANVQFFVNHFYAPDPNTPFTYTYFDIPAFMNGAFAHNQPNQTYWNFFLKSLLMSEWNWSNWLLASGISIIFLVMLAYIIYYLFSRITLDNLNANLPLLLMMFFMISASMASRFFIPWWAQANGRYVFGISVIFAIFFAKMLADCMAGKKIIPVVFGIACTALFCVLSVCMLYYDTPRMQAGAKALLPDISFQLPAPTAILSAGF